MYTADQLKAHFVDIILLFEEKQTIPDVPNVNLPSRQKILTMKLGTVSHDVQKLNEKSQKVAEELKKTGKCRVEEERLRWNVPDNNCSKN